MATIQINFFIYLTDPEQLASYQAQYPNGFIHGPQPAATEFGIPLVRRDQPLTPPCVATPWYPNVSEAKIKFDRAVFRINKGGWFGALVGANDRFVWVGWFRPAPGPTPPPETASGPVETEAIPQRRWIEGFELRSNSTTGAGASGGGLSCRDSARTPEGLGNACRSDASVVTHVLTKLTGGGTSTQKRSWERFYARARRYPTAPVEAWYCQGVGGTGAEGVKFYLAPTGQILVYGVVNGSAESLAGVGPVLPLDTWVKVDLSIWYFIDQGPPVVTRCNVKIFINGTLQASVSPTVHTSGTSISHAQSSLGTVGSSHTAEIDFDDWMNADAPGRLRAEVWGPNGNYTGLPASDPAANYVSQNNRIYRAIANSGPLNGGAVQPPNATKWIQSLGPVDWFAGSHMQVLLPKFFGADHNATAWPGEIQTLMKLPCVNDAGQSQLTSTTANSPLQIVCDQLNVQGGAVAVVGAVYGGHGGANDGLLGVGVQGAAPTIVQLTDQLSSNNWSTVLYRPAGLAAPIDLGLTRVEYRKANDTQAATVQGLFATAEYIGFWGTEDVTPDPTDPHPTPTMPPRVGPHNAPYPRSPWVTQQQAPLSAVYIVAGLYTGTAAGLDLTFRTMVHWYWQRRVSVTGSGVSWWSTMLASHRRLQRSPWPELAMAMPDLDYVSPGGAADPQERFKLRMSGSGTDNNTAASVYQYIAICDAGARFLLNGALSHGDDATADASVTVPLVDPNFAPTFAMALAERVASPVSTATGLWAKGPGHAQDAASLLDATASASAMRLAAGQLTTFLALHSPSALCDQVAYALFRAVEPGSADPGVVFQIVSYTGDGAASRTIALTPASAKRPLFALIVPANAASIFRDPSHTTNTSQPADRGSTIATGITAGGIDTITVGSTLNTNAVNYSVLVIPGSATAGPNGGFSDNGEFMPVEPAVPGGGTWTPPTFTETNIDAFDPDVTPQPTPEAPAPAAEPDLDNTTDLPGTDFVCVDFSKRLCNIALSRIGVSKQIANLNTEQSEEAVLARLHLKGDVEATLRDFPWPFATRYASLALVAGTSAVPATTDWQYAYRAPSGLVAARRIVGQAGQRRAYDPNPIQYRLGSDAGGGLLYSDAVASSAVPVVLEYTYRTSCPAYQGDPLFLDALAWRLAASFAMPLSKDSKKQMYCWAMYREALRAAEIAVANEDQKPPSADADWITGRS